MNDVTSYAFVSDGTVLDGEKGRIEFALDGHWAAPDRYRYSFTVDGPDGPAAGTITEVGGRGVGEGYDDWHGTLPFAGAGPGLPRRFGRPEVLPLDDAAIVQVPADGEAAYLIVGTRSITVRGGLGARMRVDVDVEMVIDGESFLLREKKERWEFTSFVEPDGGSSPEPDRTVVHDLTFGFSRFNVPVDIVLPADPDGPTPAPTPTTTPPPPPSAP